MKFNDALKIAVAFGITAVVMLLVYVISDIFITFLAAIIFAIALDKPIDKLVKKKIPRGLAAIIIYFVFLGALVLMLFLVLPPLAQEIRSFAVNFPLYLENLLNPQSEGAITSSESLELGQYLRALADFVGTSSQTIS